MEYTQYVRKPFVVEAVEVTVDNIKDFAPMIGQLRRKKEDKTPYIRVNPNLVPNVSAVYPGYFVTRFEGQIRAYSPKVFTREFVAANDQLLDWVNTLNTDEAAV